MPTKKETPWLIGHFTSLTKPKTIFAKERKISSIGDNPNICQYFNYWHFFDF